MRTFFLSSACAAAMAVGIPAAAAQTVKPDPAEQSDRAKQDDSNQTVGEEDIVVTATRREERIQDVPFSITAFQQEELTEKGIVGLEGLARETPGVVLNRPTQNFMNVTSRGIATNGYNAGLQTAVAVYLDELPVSTIGNTTTIDANIFDIERVEFLRGPQGTLFGSGSLSGAVRILTKSPDLNDFDVSALADLGLTGSDSFRQRYNVMVNVPVVADKLAIRAVGFYRNEEGYLDNVATGVHNSNTLINYGGRVIALWKPTDRLSIRVMGSYENSDPKDSSLTDPSLGREKRTSELPDRFAGKQTIFNATLNYEFDFAKLTSSSTYSDYDQLFWIDLKGTYPAGSYAGAPIAFGLDANGYDKVYVQETRLASSLGGPLEFVLGGFYKKRRRDVDYLYRSSLAFLAERNYTGLPDQYYQKLYAHSISEELAGFGELTYHVSDKFWLTGGARYGRASAQSFTEAGGYRALSSGYDYYAWALGNYRNRNFTTFTPYAASTGVKASQSKPSWKASASFKPSDTVTTYATFSTGFRAPIVNSRAGSVSTLNPNDVVIPNGASSDDLTSYEIGAKARWLDGRVTMNLAAYYIDWTNLQVQQNRKSDAVQFATNIGAAVSKGIEVDMGIKPATDVFIRLIASYNDSKITKLSATEAALSGAVLGHRLSAPRLQGSINVSYGFDLGADTKGKLAVNAQYVGSYNSSFPNSPSVPGTTPVPLAQFGVVDEFVNTNISFGVKRGSLSAQLYVENVFDDHSIVYIHPEAFLISRFGTLRPRTIGIRLGYGL